MSRYRMLLWVVIFLFLIYDVNQRSVKVFDVNRMAGIDYLDYWSCGRVFLAGGNPYKADLVEQVERSLGRSKPIAPVGWNPPWTFVLMLPFLALPFFVGRVIWFLFNIIVLVWAADFFWISSGGSKKDRYVSWAAILLFVPSAAGLNVGQIAPLLLVGISGFLWAEHHKRDWLAGMALILLSTKPQIIYLFCLFLALWIWQEGRWRILLGAALSLASCILIAMLINPSIFSFYINAFNSNSVPLLYEAPVPTTGLRLLFPKYDAILRYLLPLMGIIIALLLWHKWRRQFEWHKYLIPIFLLTVLTSPYGYTYDLIVLFPLAVVMILRYQRKPHRQLPWLIGLIAVQILTAALLFSTNRSIVLLWVGPAMAILYWLSCRATSRETSLRNESGRALCSPNRD